MANSMSVSQQSDEQMERATFRRENDILYLYLHGGRIVCPRLWLYMRVDYQLLQPDSAVLNVQLQNDGSVRLYPPWRELVEGLTMEGDPLEPYILLREGDLVSMQASLTLIREQTRPEKMEGIADIFQSTSGTLLTLSRAPVLYIHHWNTDVLGSQAQLVVSRESSYLSHPAPFWLRLMDGMWTLLRKVEVGGDSIWREYDEEPIEMDYWYIPEEPMAIEPNWLRPPTYVISTHWAPPGYQSIWSGAEWGIWIWKPTKR